MESTVAQRLEVMEKQIERYKPNNPKLELGKLSMVLLAAEIRELWMAFGEIDEEPPKPTNLDEAETPKADKAHLGATPPSPSFEKVDSPDPRTDKTVKADTGGGDLDDMIKDIK